MTEPQDKAAEGIRTIHTEIVNEPFRPEAAPYSLGKENWPYVLTEPDIIRIARAIQLGQKKILVPKDFKDG